MKFRSQGDAINNENKFRYSVIRFQLRTYTEISQCSSNCGIERHAIIRTVQSLWHL